MIAIICILSALVLVLLYLIVSLILCFVLHKRLFLHRERDSDGVYVRYEERKDKLERKPYTAYYYQKKINGYIYSLKGRENFKGFIVLSHGKFGTHIQYLIDILFLCQNGYQVLAYDQLGSGRSEGSVQESLATGIYVAENVLNDVIKRKVNHGLPIFVYGHSWGAYSRAGAIRKYPEVRGAVLRSAPINESKSVLDVRKKEKKGLYYFLLPSYKFCRFFLEGARYIVSSKKGIRKNKTTKILLIYALNDPIVSHNNSLALYFKKHPQSNVENYIQEKGLHNSIITEESYHWFNTENKKIKTELMNNGADKKAREEKILSLAPLSHIVYDEGAERKILSFLDQFAD